MSTKTVLFFTAGAVATAGELATKAKLAALAEPALNIRILSARAHARISAATLSAVASDKSIRDSANGLLTAGFLAGQHVRVRGFTGDTRNNLAEGVIGTADAGKITLPASTMYDDAAGETVVIETIETDARYGGGVIPADYVCGTIPAAYRSTSTGSPIYPVLDPDAPPAADNLPATQAIVNDGGTLTVGGATITLTVADNEVTDVSLPATKCVVAHGQVINITAGGTVTLTVAGGAITGAVYAAGG